MCGICGIISVENDARPDTAVVQRMTRALAHRGPDGEGIWTSADGRAILGHRRLSIIDLSPAGAQPMISADRKIAVTFNGEIYNYRSLRKELEGGGASFSSHTDTETLLHLWRKQGADMVEALDGDYAFALWDEDKKSLFLARDRIGVKPLYYAFVKGFFIFASEIGALLASGFVKFDIDEESLYHYLTYLVSPPGHTMVRGVKKLEPGTSLSLSSDGTMIKKRYWDPLPRTGKTNSEDLDVELEALFKSSVEKRMMSDVPVGILFSGGVDSTLNAGAFRDIAASAVNSFTVGMPGTRNDESAGARAMARHLGLNHHEIMITENDVRQALPAIASAEDEPIGDPVCLPLYFVSKLAREKGVTVLQAGEGADELFCGYAAYVKRLHAYRHYWRTLEKLPRFVPRILARATGGAAADALKRLGAGREFFMSAAVGFYESEKKDILSPELLSRVRGMDSYDVVEPLYRHLKAEVPEADFLSKMTYVELNLRLPELLLMRVDKMSMAHSLEVRVPFLDHKLIEFSLAAPESFKFRGGIPKEPIKRLAARYAPAKEIYKPKQGFGAPILQWLGGELGADMRRLLISSGHEFFNVPELLSRLDGGIRTTREAFQLWIIYNFLLWRQEKSALYGKMV